MDNSTIALADVVFDFGNPMSNPEFIKELSEYLHKSLRISTADVEEQAIPALRRMFEPMIENGLTLARGVKTHAEQAEGSAGTHAYNMLAAYAAEDASTTSQLIELVTATVLAKLIQEEGGGRANVTFGPHDMDAMMSSYDIDATREGLLLTVRIMPRKDNTTHIMAQDEDTRHALQQADPIEERLYWAMRDGGGLHYFNDREEAQASVLVSVDPIAHVENRMCQHDACPADHCNQAEEVTSEPLDITE